MGRPSKALLDKERIAATALDLVDAEGDFSVPKIARRLGVQTASVHHHVGGRAGIVELLRVRIAEDIDTGALDLSTPAARARRSWPNTRRRRAASPPTGCGSAR